MAGTIVNNPVVQFFDNNGNPLVGGKITTYLSNTTTPASTWQNEALSTLNTNPIILNSRGEATIWLTPDIQYTFVLTDADDNLIQTVNDIYGSFQVSNGMSASNVSYTFPDGTVGNVQELSGDNGADGIGYLSPGDNTVSTTVGQKLDQIVSVFDYLTEAQIDDVQSYAFSINVSTPLQQAINDAWNSGNVLYFPPGGYLANSLSISEDGTQAARVLNMKGGGIGNPFTVGVNEGTVIKGLDDDPVFAVYTSSSTTSTGTLRIEGISFVGESTTAVVFLEGFYGTSEISNVVVYQGGTGNGMQIDSMATGYIKHCYFLNKDLVTFGLGPSRTGIGLFVNQLNDAGLQTISKCSSRGFLTAYKIGAGTGSTYTYNASIEDCECSITYNGIHLTVNARSTWVNNCYLEGGEGGIGIWDQGDYNHVTNCFTFSGYSVHLKSTDFTYGNSYSNNTFSAGTSPNQVLIDITSSSVSGGPGKNCFSNHLSFGGSGGTIAGVIGLRINGTDPRLNLIGNKYFPRDSWVGGAGTTKISDLSSGGVIGITTTISGSGNQEIPLLSRGAISLEMGDTGLSQLNVSGSILSVPGGSLFYCNTTTPVAVDRLSTDQTAGRLLIFNTLNTNMTFTNSSFMIMNSGVNFASRGNIVFYTQIVAGDTYAYEIARSTY